jgi:hypothetical protein
MNLEDLERILTLDNLERRQLQQFERHQDSILNELILTSHPQRNARSSHAYEAAISAPMLLGEAYIRQP